MGQFKTPLRYPGGKQRLSPFIEELFQCNNLLGGHYVEPFAGGAGVAMELLLNNVVSEVHLNDSDLAIYAFWHSILNSPEEFCREIMKASHTIDEWKYRREIVKRRDDADLFELGYSMFYLNRCNRSGVINAGVIGGMDQSGNFKMDARFSRNDLIHRIEAIAIHSKNIHISNMDAENYVTNYFNSLPHNSLIYFDPPYFNKGSDLYFNYYKKDDHIRLSNLIKSEVKHKWLLSYDAVPEVLSIYGDKRHFIYSLQYSAAKVYKGSEVFIFGDNVNIPLSSSLKHVDTGLKSVKIA